MLNSEQIRLQLLEKHSQTKELLKGCNSASLTPADAEVNVEVVPLGEDGDDQQAVQIQTLHQQPVVVGHDTVLQSSPSQHGNRAPSEEHMHQYAKSASDDTFNDQSQTA